MSDTVNASSAQEPLSDPVATGEAHAAGLVEGFAVTADGQVTGVTDPLTKPPKRGFLWLHLQLDTSRALVEGSLGLEPLVARSLLASETRPRCRHLPGGTLINLRGVNLNEGKRPEDMLSLRCWLEPNRLVTARLQRSAAIEALRKRYRDGQAHDGPGGLLVDIIGGLLDRIDPMADGLADALDPLEDRVAEEEDGEALRDRIAAMRHDAVTYRRYLAPMRDAIVRLGTAKTGTLSETDLTAVEEEADRATRIVEELEITVERASVLVDQMTAMRSEKMNRNMMVLSVVSAVFLPLTFLTGLLGINVGGIPGAENESAFWWVLGICLTLGATAGAFFRARDWL